MQFRTKVPTAAVSRRQWPARSPAPARPRRSAGATASWGMTHHDGTQPRSQQTARAQCGHGAPLDRRDGREDHRRDAVGQAQQDVLRCVGMRQRGMPHPQEQGQQQHPAAAPKYPPYTAMAKTATPSKIRTVRLRRLVSSAAGGLWGNTIASDAPPSRMGTTFSKPSAGVDNSRSAPAAPPSSVSGAMRSRKRPCPSVRAASPESSRHR